MYYKREIRGAYRLYKGAQILFDCGLIERGLVKVNEAKAIMDKVNERRRVISLAKKFRVLRGK